MHEDIRINERSRSFCSRTRLTNMVDQLITRLQGLRNIQRNLESQHNSLKLVARSGILVVVITGFGWRGGFGRLSLGSGSEDVHLDRSSCQYKQVRMSVVEDASQVPLDR